ncbi:MAG: hypothetical protein AAF555_01955 [Verrucomicrobiota bacterium]
MTDEILQWESLEFSGETFEHEVTGVFFNVLGDGGNGVIFTHNGSDCLAFEGGAEFIGVVFHLEQAHRAADFVQCALTEGLTVEFQQPLDFANVGVALTQIQEIFIVPDNSSEVELARAFVGKDDKVSDLHFVKKAKELSGVVRNRSGLFLGIGFGNCGLEGFSVGCQLGEVSHLIPTKRDTGMLEEQSCGISSLAGMDAPDGFVFSCLAHD